MVYGVCKKCPSNTIQIGWKYKIIQKRQKKKDDTNTNQSTLQNKENYQSPKKMHNDKKLNSKKTYQLLNGSAN